ncbi:MAG TPA: aldehyde dehydrogenase family protein, partial [Longimicrobiales bacterium]|nr:aldehyde dehydrogenase family protein [Longimicrobiales bacterium]
TWKGRVGYTPLRDLDLAIPEALGVVGIVCPDEAPLLGFVSTVAPALAAGNAVVAVPSRVDPVVASGLLDLLNTADLPGGVVNLVTGLHREVVPTLAAHRDVEGIWYFGPPDGAGEVERLSADTLKRTWCSRPGIRRDWFDPAQGEGEAFLREATRVRRIRIPFGE